MLAVLFILGALCPLNFAGIPIRLLIPGTDGVLAGRFPNALLLTMPDCNFYGNKSANLTYTDVLNKETNTTTFQVPACSASKLGYLLQGLKSETTYNLTYTIDNEISTVLTEMTTTALDYKQIDSGLPARSGAMVVITVILALAMVMLVAGLIISMLFSG